MPINPDTVYLGHMAESVARIADFGKLSSRFVSANPQVPWREMTGLRHKLIHDYFEVDLDIVWRTATVNVPEISAFLRTARGESDQ